MNHAKGGLGFKGRCACGEDMMGCPGQLGLGSETCSVLGMAAGTPELRVARSLVLGHCPCAQPGALVGVK